MFRSKFLPLMAAVLLLAFCVSNVSADDRYTTLKRGDGGAGITAADGDKWYITYDTDGTTPYFTAWESPVYWSLLLANQMTTPATQLEVYLMPTTPGPWRYQLLGRYQVAFWNTSLKLTAPKGYRYLFAIANWQQATPIAAEIK